jgi:hypothetical protein
MPVMAENDFQLRLAESLVRYLGGAPTSRALAESI